MLIMIVLQVISSNIYAINSILLTEHKISTNYNECFTHTHSHIHEGHHSFIELKHQHKHSHGKKNINISDFVAHNHKISLTDFQSSNDLYLSINYWTPNPIPKEIFRPPRS